VRQPLAKEPPIRKTCKRYNEPGDAHELTFSCFKRRPFLSKDRTRRWLAEAIAKARAKHGFHLWGYVFMPEHAHLLIWPPDPQYAIENILKSIKQSVARRALIHLRRHNPSGLKRLATGQRGKPYRFWMPGGGYDRNIVKLGTVGNALKYIHNNPVRRGLAPVAEEWHWSSAREWEEPGTGQISVDSQSFPLLR